MTWVAVLAAAAVGAPLRFLLDRWVTERTAGASGWRLFPWGLLSVNVLGSAVAGVVLATASGVTRTLLLVGLCGAFTTFSGFAWEAERLRESSRSVFWWAVTVMPLACLAAFWTFWQAFRVLTG